MSKATSLADPPGRDRPHDRRRRARKRALLAAYVKLGTVSAAVRAARVHIDTHYEWLKADADYAARFLTAQTEAGELLEAEAWRRASQGVSRPVYQGGRKVGVTREYSDVLLIFLLKGHYPDKYRERLAVEQRWDLSSLSDVQLDQLEGLLAQTRRRSTS